MRNEQMDALFEQAFRARGDECEVLLKRLSECAEEDVFNAAHRNFERYGNWDRIDFPKKVFPDHEPITYEI